MAVIGGSEGRGRRGWVTGEKFLWLQLSLPIYAIGVRVTGLLP
jgi:hypothetical protein